MQALMGSSPLHTDRDSPCDGFLGAGFAVSRRAQGPPPSIRRYSLESVRRQWWAWQDSNLRPHGCEPYALAG